MADARDCEGRYCPCRSHLHPQMPKWVLDVYMPSRWALETIHGIYVEGRNRDQITDEERAVLTAELANLEDMVRAAMSGDHP